MMNYRNSINCNICSNNNVKNLLSDNSLKLKKFINISQ